MAVIDQVLLLQEKVESAVQKIVQLKSENDALRKQCSELTNALSEKTELLNSFTADEEKIESSIKDAINRLDTLENSVITGGTASAGNAQPAKPAEASNPTPAAKPAAENQTQTKPVSQPAPQNAAPVETPAPQSEQPSEEADDMDFSLDLSTDSPDSNSEEANQPEEKFDIF